MYDDWVLHKAALLKAFPIRIGIFKDNFETFWLFFFILV